VRFDFVIHHEKPGRPEHDDDDDSQNDPTGHDYFLLTQRLPDQLWGAIAFPHYASAKNRRRIPKFPKLSYATKDGYESDPEYAQQGVLWAFKPENPYLKVMIPSENIILFKFSLLKIGENLYTIIKVSAMRRCFPRGEKP
jgi:hypothetical protein